MAQVIEGSIRQKRARKNARRNVPPGRSKNSDVRSREYLLAEEVSALIMAAKKVGRHQIRDHAMILAMYRHGLRVTELIELKLDQVDFRNASMHVKRIKNGTPSVRRLRATSCAYSES